MPSLQFVMVTADILILEFSSSPAVYFCVSLMNGNFAKAGEHLPRVSPVRCTRQPSPSESCPLLGVGIMSGTDIRLFNSCLTFPFPGTKTCLPSLASPLRASLCLPPLPF